MFEKLLFGFIAFVVSFFAIHWLVFRLVHSLLWTPRAFEDDMVSIDVYVRSGALAFLSAVVGGTIIACVVARLSGRLLKRRSPESFRGKSALPISLRQEPPGEA